MQRAGVDQNGSYVGPASIRAAFIFPFQFTAKCGKNIPERWHVVTALVGAVPELRRQSAGIYPLE